MFKNIKRITLSGFFFLMACAIGGGAQAQVPGTPHYAQAGFDFGSGINAWTEVAGPNGNGNLQFNSNQAPIISSYASTSLGSVSFTATPWANGNVSSEKGGSGNVSMQITGFGNIGLGKNDGNLQSFSNFQKSMNLSASSNGNGSANISGGFTVYGNMGTFNNQPRTKQ